MQTEGSLMLNRGGEIVGHPEMSPKVEIVGRAIDVLARVKSIMFSDGATNKLAPNPK